MNPGICYLYEYEKNSRKRNAGFIKAARHYHSCILQIHARGIPLGNGTQLELYAFYRDEEYLNASRIAVLTCLNRTISMRIAVSESHFPEGRNLQQIDGFLIKLPGRENPLFWAASPIFFPVSLDMLRIAGEEKEQAGTAEITDEKPQTEEPCEESVSAEPPEKSVPAEPSEESVAGDQADTAAGRTDQEEAAPEQADSVPEQAEAAEVREAAADSRPAARKIQRSEISHLPRRFWFLANNSFLLHGYHNYNHLLLVEEDGHMWLGVPGVYDPREARAADLFGFPQFTRTYAPLIGLAGDECCDSEDFGHWCRYIDTGSADT